MEDDLNERKIKWKTNQSTKINLIGCDTIVNSPSLSYTWYCSAFPWEHIFLNISTWGEYSIDYKGKDNINYKTSDIYFTSSAKQVYYWVLVFMIFSEVRMYWKQMNETNTHIFFNFVLENTHKYHENYSINTLKF